MRLGLGLSISKNNGKFAGGLDADAAAFLTAAGITDATITAAINRLVLNYKGVGDLNATINFWSDQLAIYPIVGGTATTHKFNLKDPRDLDAAYRLSFSGGWTHSANGALPNGTNAFANTFLNATTLSNTDASLGFYSRTDIVQDSMDISASVGGVDTSIAPKWNTLGSLSRIASVFTGAGYNPTNTLGLFCTSKITSGVFKRYKNGLVGETVTFAGSAQPNANIYLGCRNVNGTPSAYSTRQNAFAFIGKGITSDANALLIYNIIQQFQTDLARNI
jgi:hypothetical protein